MIKADVLLIKSIQHQVFGKFSGTLKIGEETIEIKDLVGFAEKLLIIGKKGCENLVSQPIFI